MKLFAVAGALLLTALVDGGGTAANAQSQGRWCQLDRSMTAVNCSFRTFRQCQATVSGIGGVCQLNPRRNRGYRVYR